MADYRERQLPAADDPRDVLTGTQSNRPDALVVRWQADPDRRERSDREAEAARSMSEC